MKCILKGMFSSSKGWSEEGGRDEDDIREEWKAVDEEQREAKASK